MGDEAHACRGEPLSFGNTLFTKEAVPNIQKLEIENNKYLQYICLCETRFTA